MTSNSTGTLYLVPSALGKPRPEDIAPSVKVVLDELDYMIVERPKTTRRFLRGIDPGFDLDNLEMFHLYKKTPPEEWRSFLTPLQEGHDVGLLSEAGAPAIADPGTPIVREAHRQSIRVAPRGAASSITLALMGSGLNGQQFAFWGYLSRDSQQRLKQLKRLESWAREYDQTQLFMETPYRNQHILKAVVDHCKLDTDFCIAANLTMENEYIRTQTVKEWKSDLPDLHKQPAIFGLGW